MNGETPKGTGRGLSALVLWQQSGVFFIFPSSGQHYRSAESVA